MSHSEAPSAFTEPEFWVVLSIVSVLFFAGLIRNGESPR